MQDSRLKAGALCLGLLATSTLAAGSAKHPYSVALDIGYGDPRGPQTLLDDVREQLEWLLSSRGCFSRVEQVDPDHPPQTDLLLVVTLFDYKEETRYDLSIAARAQAQDPEALTRLVAEFFLSADIRLLTAGELAELRSSRSRIHTVWRPRAVFEDDAYAREAARERGVSDLVQDVASKACKGSAKKLQKQLEQARTAAEPNNDER